MNRLIIGLILTAFLVSACSAPTPAPAPAPRPSSPVQTPLASAPTSPLPTAVVVATPSKPDRCTITGILLQGPDERPAQEAIVYLAGVIQTGDTPTLASFDRGSSPRTQTDAYGRFVFVDVPVERYGLVLDRVNQSFLLKNPKDNSDMLFTPKSGQVLDLGKLVYPSLP